LHQAYSLCIASNISFIAIIRAVFLRYLSLRFLRISGDSEYAQSAVSHSKQLVQLCFLGLLIINQLQFSSKAAKI